MSRTHVAIVDDKTEITSLVSYYLDAHGFRVTPLHRGLDLLALMDVDPPTLVMLDLGLPGEDGVDIARQLHARRQCGLIIVTGSVDVRDDTVDLESLCDDFVTKPFDLPDLVRRIRAVLLRRASSEPDRSQGLDADPRRWSFLGMHLDMPTRRLNDAQGQRVDLTSGEFDLLVALVRHAGLVVSREFLLQQAHGRTADPFADTIDAQVHRLQMKIEGGLEGSVIRSARGAGYVFVAEISLA